MIKTKLCAVLALLFLFLSGCGGLGGVTEFDATLYVRGYLDEAYLAEYDPVFLKLVDSTRDEAESFYNAGIDAQYTYFCDRFSIDDGSIESDTREDLKDLMKTMLSRARYDVASAVTMDGGEYAVRVTVYPITLPRDVLADDYDGYLKAFNAAHTNLTQERLDLMSDRDRNRALAEYEDDWAQGIVKLFAARTAAIAFGDAQVKLVRVYPAQEQDVYTMSDLDFAGLDALILAYD